MAFEADEELLLSAKLEQSFAPSFELDSEDHGILRFIIQQSSSSWGFRMPDFAIRLLLITYFEDTLLPNGIYGFSGCVTNILLAPWLGSLVDQAPKLTLVRGCLIAQKLSATCAFAAFAFLFSFKHTNDSKWAQSITSPAFQLIVLAGCVLQASNTCLEIALRQDWAISIAEGSEERLSHINAMLKRADLLCKLLAPLVVSILTTYVSHMWAATGMAGLMLIVAIADVFLVKTVYCSYPSLARDEVQAKIGRVLGNTLMGEAPTENPVASWGPREVVKCWGTFYRLPTFLSSLAAAFLAMNALAFDGFDTFISNPGRIILIGICIIFRPMLWFLKTQNQADNTLSAARGFYVLTGLLGTWFAPWLEGQVGSIHCGTISFWSAVGCLLPAILSLHLMWTVNQSVAFVVLFIGVASSGIGISAFELVQVKQLQLAIECRLERNTLASIQVSLQHVSDLMIYVLTMLCFAKPAEYKWTASVSFASITIGGFWYLIYARRNRGNAV